ncbi:MAG: coenzyme F420-0:L-glutamate ligase [Tissierellia bacterium]|nr:coenzyme F420-0:L-glutamate ligase [Tissierellia bacterium]
MDRLIGTNAMGVRLPIIKRGDDLVETIAQVFAKFVDQYGIELEEKDVLGVTESLLARAQGNYVSLDHIKEDINRKFDDEISIVAPILSRNRFSNILKGIALSGKKIKIFLSYPSDEVGNSIMDRYEIMKKDINIYKETLTEKDYLDLLGDIYLHPFTGVNYVELYKSMAVDNNIEILFSNNLDDIAKRSKAILIANIHEEEYLKEFFTNKGLEKVYSLRDIMAEPIDESGYNADYGLYGSNLSSGDSLKLFPRDSKVFVDRLQKSIEEKTGVRIETLVYGDGAFKDPIGGIWELADPVVSPGYTEGLEGVPNELKLKYLADNELKDLSGEEAIKAMKSKIVSKNQDLDTNERLGTTPRKITDLIGSLCDLVSGSGDKGTPVVYIKGYFDNYSNE